MPIAITLLNPGKMDKKIALALVAGITTGIAIYLLSKVMKEKKSAGQADENSLTKPKRTYSYEYTL
jgi:hypothetical protein